MDPTLWCSATSGMDGLDIQVGCGMEHLMALQTRDSACRKDNPAPVLILKFKQHSYLYNCIIQFV